MSGNSAEAGRATIKGTLSLLQVAVQLMLHEVRNMAANLHTASSHE